MKTFKFLSFALVLLSIMSCSKKDSLITDIVSSQKVDGSGRIVLTTGVSFNPAPAVVGEPVTIKAFVYDEVEGNYPTDGTIKLEQAVDADGNPTTTALAVGYIPLASASASAGEASFIFTPTAAGFIGYRAHYTPQGNTYAQNNSIKADLEIINPCIGLILGANLISAVPDGNETRITAKYTITACADYTGLKLQGGLTAGASLIAAGTTAGYSVKSTKQNTIISWNVGDMTAGSTKVYTVVFKKKLTGSGPWTVTGAWSVKGLDASLLEVLAGYNNAVEVE